MKVAAGTVVVMGIVAALVGVMALNGFMLSYLWEWFVVPLGAPPIGLLHAIGIAVLVSMLTFEGGGRAGDGEDALKLLFARLVAKLVAFGIAWAVSFGVAA
jgi:hypothetical protein